MPSNKRKIAPRSFAPPRRVELDYKRAIDRLLMKYLHFSPTASLTDILQRMSHLSENSSFIQESATAIARGMVLQIKNYNAKSWRDAAQKIDRGREIYEALQQEMNGPVGHHVNLIVAENAKLITSVPADITESLTKEIARLQLQGLRPEAIAARIQKRIPHLTKNRVALIARTESSKASTALSESRSASLGIKYYEWSTSEDMRVRTSHRNMDHVLVPWAEPPSPESLVHEKSTLGHYHAGGCPNCRCDCLPIISLDEVKFPARVYSHGRIQRMTLSQFKKHSGMLVRRAVA